MTRAINPANKSQTEALLNAFLECRSKITSMVARIVGPSEIEDIVQEAFARSIEAARVKPIHRPGAFMYQTARNLALNHVTSASHRLADPIEDLSSTSASPETDTPSVESEVEAKERFLLFCRALSQVPVQCRRVFILKKVYGLSQKEIADRLGISRSTVEKHVAKGLLLCSKYLAAAEADSRPALQDVQDRRRESSES